MLEELAADGNETAATTLRVLAPPVMPIPVSPEDEARRAALNARLATAMKAPLTKAATAFATHATRLATRTTPFRPPLPPFQHVPLLGEGGHNVSFTSDSRALASGSRMWNTKGWGNFDGPPNAGAHTFSPDGRLAARVREGDVPVPRLGVGARPERSSGPGTPGLRSAVTRRRWRPARTCGARAPGNSRERFDDGVELPRGAGRPDLDAVPRRRDRPAPAARPSANLAPVGFRAVLVGAWIALTALTVLLSGWLLGDWLFTTIAGGLVALIGGVVVKRWWHS